MVHFLKARFVVLCIVVLLPMDLLLGQDCDLPILSSFSDFTTEGFSVSWIDFNSGTVSWDVEYGLKDFTPLGVPTIAGIGEKTISISGLQSGTTYELYLRSNCANNEFSSWNGPYFANTVISNESACKLDLDISDNNCPLSDLFKIEVKDYDGLELGTDLILENVELIIAHTWPPDLQLTLIAPDRTEVLLSQFNGTGADDYGNSKDVSCTETVAFTDNACFSIEEAVPPFVGAFSPEESMSDLLQGIDPNGIWELSICDRANGDFGKLEYFSLNFSEQACVVPSSFSISDIEADNITVTWDSGAVCEALEISYKEQSAPIQGTSSDYIVCTEGNFNIQELRPNTTYELSVRSDCGVGVFSPFSCVTLFTTACSNSLFREEFDDKDLCGTACQDLCKIDGIWRNVSSANTEWIVHSGPTKTTFTGPEADRKGSGNYLYIETQEGQCELSSEVILESKCLTKPDNQACALSFSYHMFGNDVGLLNVFFSEDSISWISIWSQSGSQSNQWNFAKVAFDSSFERGLFRFSARRLDGGVRGDIAIDNIKLIGIDTIEPLLLYEDTDGDGFGNGAVPRLVCSNVVTNGFSENGDDCDDNNSTSFPGAVEIACNQVDENCNGMADDIGNVNITYLLGNIIDESCKGAADGIITLQANNGTPPYQYEWSDGSIGQGVTDLESGIYTCTITDFNGCQSVTDPIFVDFENIVVYSVNTILASSCKGADDGAIELLIEGGIPPYSVTWNNGFRGSSIDDLVDGYYHATITDRSSCAVVTDSILINGPQILTTGVADKRDNDCNGESTGFIRIGILGGLPPYDISWSNGASDNFINQLVSGLYSVTVTDQNNCQNVISDIEVQEPMTLAVELSSIEHITCSGGTNSFVDVTVRGGTAPYSFFWSDGTNDQDLVNRAAGLYSVTVSDIKSCSAVLSDVEILQPAPVVIEVDSVVNVNCSGSKFGYVSVDVEGGTGDYVYNWGLFDGSNIEENYLDSLQAGNYSLTVVDDFGCKSRAFSVEVSNLNIPLNINSTLLQDIICFGDSTGRISAEVLNGLAPYDFNWSSGDKVVQFETRDTLNGLLSESYNLTITDAEGCKGISDSISVRSNSEIKFTITDRAQNDCWQDSSGVIEIAVVGGVTPYDIEWSSGQTGTRISQLGNGEYIAMVSDREGCLLETSPISVTSNPQLTIHAALVHPTEGSLGSISLTADGGDGMYTYTWADPLENYSGPDIEGLTAGAYALTLTDGLGCTIDTTLLLEFLTAVSDVQNYTVALYPNPTTGDVHIENLACSGQLSLMNLRGQLLYSSAIQSGSQTLSLKEYRPGVYYLLIQCQEYQWIEKVLLLDN